MWIFRGLADADGSLSQRMPMARTSGKAELNVRADVVEVGAGDAIGEANGAIFCCY